MPLYIVDTIMTMRMRYVVEAKELDHALDEVTMIDSGAEQDYFEAFSQKYISENIIDSREINKDEFTEMLKQLEHSKDEHGSYWLKDKLIRVIDYERIYGNQRKEEQEKGS